jgi:hypothetical protein
LSALAILNVDAGLYDLAARRGFIGGARAAGCPAKDQHPGTAEVASQSSTSGVVPGSLRWARGVLIAHLSEHGADIELNPNTHNGGAHTRIAKPVNPESVAW